VPEIYQNLYGCKTYKQDLQFKPGIQGTVIGGDASHMPLPGDFATHMGLHCSFEHFEGGSDIEFIREAGRVLSPGGKLCILPLYLFTSYAILSDPCVLPKRGMNFENDATIYCVKNYFNRHGRNYDVDHFINRIVKNLGPLNLTVYIVNNADVISPVCHLRFAALFEKKP
jgi:SAM-dependent methyltransferase